MPANRTVGWYFVTAGFCLTLVCQGCSSGGSPPSSVKGRIECSGKPVFPVVLMLKSGSGKSFTANVKNSNGEFTIFGIESGVKYEVAIEPIQLAGISQAERAAASKAAETAAAEGRELRREETIPSQFQNANIDFPKKYRSFETSGLTVDCSIGVPNEPIVFDLK